MDPKLNTRLFHRGDNLLVALSGGADSLTLLHLLVAARREWRLELGAVHVHHGMRGARADEDVRRLEALCRQWAVELRVEHADVPALALSSRISVEEAGRDARYAAFTRVAADLGASRVATAHTADDQVETILFRLLRGTGTDGLAGIPERRRLSPTLEVVRPLLGAWRSEIEEYVRAHGLEALDDCTNRDLRYRRSRIRHELLPLLQAYGPDVKEALLRLSRQARDEGALLDALAAGVLAEARPADQPGFPWQTGAPALRIAPLAAAPPALARRALRLALREVCGWGAEVDAALLEGLMTLVVGDGAAVEIPGAERRARRYRGALRFERTRAGTPPESRLVVALPGTTLAPAWCLRVTAGSTVPPADLRLPPLEAVLDAAMLRGSLRLRAPHTGDRFHPLNGPGTRLLSDLFLDRRIPAGDRAGWPVFEDDAGIVWVPGVALAHRLRVQPGTAGCWRLRLAPYAILGPSEEVP